MAWHGMAWHGMAWRSTHVVGKPSAESSKDLEDPRLQQDGVRKLIALHLAPNLERARLQALPVQHVPVAGRQAIG